MNSATCNVIALSVKDKFGDFGITGVAILETQNNTNIIDTFLLSCRVLGRKVEKWFLIECLSVLFKTNSFEVIGVYVPTPKNSQVKDFYLDAGFEVLEENNQFVKYILYKKNFFQQASSIIKINYGK
jgi:predicted enzyme involved in methoxymalonyl-ACP biosynthesis